MLSDVGEVLGQLDAVVSDLAALPFDLIADDDVLEVLKRVEVAKRRLAPVDHELIGQVQARSLAFSNGARTATSLLGQLLRISGPEAAGRVKAAEALGRRVTVCGARVEPQYPLVAAAQADGVISDRHAKAVVDAVSKLPDSLVDEFDDFLERTLVEQA